MVKARRKSRRLHDVEIVTYSDISVAKRVGYAFTVLIDGEIKYKEAGVFPFEPDHANSITFELYAISAALETLPLGAKVLVFSDLNEIHKLASRSSRGANAIKDVIKRKKLIVTYKYMEKGDRPKHYNRCHSRARYHATKKGTK